MKASELISELQAVTERYGKDYDILIGRNSGGSPLYTADMVDIFDDAANAIQILTNE